MDTQFSATLFEWRGPAPFYWLPVPPDSCEYVRGEAAQASYGWGAIPVRARIGGTEWETSLLPKNGRYLLPVKTAVRERNGSATATPSRPLSAPSRVAAGLDACGGRSLAGPSSEPDAGAFRF